MKEKPTFDIVTVAFGEDLGLLALQAEGLSRFCPPELVGQILMIGNDPDPVWFRMRFEKDIRPLYGPLQSKVRYLDRRSMGLAPLKRKGYGAQQTLKLMAARFASSKYMLITDAKLHPLRQLVQNDFFDETGLALLDQYPLNPKFGPKLHASYRFFTERDEDAPIDPNRCFPMTIPLLLVRSECLELMEAVEDKSGKPFERAFGSDIRANEFYLYAAWLYSRPGTIERYYTDGPKTAFILYAQLHADSMEGLQRVIEGPKPAWITVHRTLLADADAKLKAMIETVWRDAGYQATAHSVLEGNKVPSAFVRLAQKWGAG